MDGYPLSWRSSTVDTAGSVVRSSMEAVIAWN